MKIGQYQRVALTKDIPEEHLRKGDVVTVVEKLPPTDESHGEHGLAVEVFNALGETTAVVFVPESYVRPLESNEVFHIRKLSKAM